MESRKLATPSPSSDPVFPLESPSAAHAIGFRLSVKISAEAVNSIRCLFIMFLLELAKTIRDRTRSFLIYKIAPHFKAASSSSFGCDGEHRFIGNAQLSIANKPAETFEDIALDRAMAGRSNL